MQEVLSCASKRKFLGHSGCLIVVPSSLGIRTSQLWSGRVPPRLSSFPPAPSTPITYGTCWSCGQWLGQERLVRPHPRHFLTGSRFPPPSGRARPRALTAAVSVTILHPDSGHSQGWGLSRERAPGLDSRWACRGPRPSRKGLLWGLGQQPLRGLRGLKPKERRAWPISKDPPRSSGLKESLVICLQFSKPIVGSWGNFVLGTFSDFWEHF